MITHVIDKYVWLTELSICFGIFGIFAIFVDMESIGLLSRYLFLEYCPHALIDFIAWIFI